LKVGLNPGCWRASSRDHRFTDQDRDIAAVFARVETQRNVAVAGYMLHFGRLSLTEDQYRSAVPVKPDWPGLGTAVRINCGQPDDLLLA
jgi:hypothetical protein